jgi:two-component system, NtrC family, sensor histidine kinase HydH
MFRTKASEVHIRIPLTAAIVVAALLLAFAMSAAAVYQVLEEYRLLGSWLSRPGSVSDAEIDDLRQDIGARIRVRTSALAALLLCTVATLLLQQRQLAIRRTLHQVKLLTRDILASMDQGVITTDLHGIITSINSATKRILGLESGCVGRPLESISTGGVPLVALASQVAERGVAVWDQDFVVDLNGRVRTVRAHAHVLRDRAGKFLGCVMLLRDVSDRVLMEERVRRMERFGNLGTLASGLHHEIKNPLTALSIHVQLLEKQLRDPASKRPVDELIGVLKSEVHRLTAVLESFRDFASLQHLTLRPTDVSEILGDVARLIGPQADQQHVEVTLRCPKEGLPQVLLDVEKFKQAILNVVVNALEAMTDGGILALIASGREGELLVEVVDSGPGIPAEIRGEVFKPYFSTKCQGTKMGLALTEKLIGQHGGRVEFQTNSRGTTFCLAIPIDPEMAGSARR